MRAFDIIKFGVAWVIIYACSFVALLLVVAVAATVFRLG